MHIAYDALTLRPGAYSGVHVAVRGSLRALAAHLGGDDALTYYALKSMPASDAPPDGNGRVRRRAAGFPTGTRAGRIWWENNRWPRVAARDGADLLHAPAYAGPPRPGRPMVLTVHDILGLARPDLCTWATRRHLHARMPEAMAAAARIVTPTRAVADDIVRWRKGGGKLAERAGPLDALTEKLRVVPWGVDARFARVTDGAALDALRMRHRLPPEFALIAARPEPKKNLPMAVRGFFAAAMAQQLPHRLVIVGPPGWRSAEKTLAGAIRELGFDDRVLRLGFVPDEDMPGLYSLASCLLFPSRAEGFGLPVLEALACGCPVVASPLPPLVELVGRDGARWADPTDLPAWRKAIESTLTDSSKTRRLAAAGPKIAATYTWTRHAEKLMEVYRETLAIP